MLSASKVSRIRLWKSCCLKQFFRAESSADSWNTVRTIRNTNWPILKGETVAEKTKLMTPNFFKKRIMNTVPKSALLVSTLPFRTGWQVSALGYGRGGSRIANDDWSGELQRACRFGTNFIQALPFIHSDA